MKGLGLEPNLGLFGWVKKLNPTFTREPYINSGKVYKKIRYSTRQVTDA